MDGIVIVHKDRGMTSFDVIAKMRRILSMKKIGHAGTLDPDATGVLPVCLGKATRLIEYLMDKDKSYRAVLRLGIETNTQDASGNITGTADVTADDAAIMDAVRSFIGPVMQVPPMYSAIRVGGKRLYELARKGVEIEREARLITISDIRNIQIIRHGSDVHVSFEVDCSKGTYIRTLCADIGKKLGCGGHMASLVRTRSGPFTLENAVTLEELSSHQQTGTLHKVIMEMDRALEGFPSLCLDEVQGMKLRNGLKIILPTAHPEGLTRLYSAAGQFLAIGQVTVEEGRTYVKSHKWLEV